MDDNLTPAQEALVALSLQQRRKIRKQASRIDAQRLRIARLRGRLAEARDDEPDKKPADKKSGDAPEKKPARSRDTRADRIDMLRDRNAKLRERLAKAKGEDGEQEQKQPEQKSSGGSGKITVKQHQRTSVKGKSFTVKEHQRNPAKMSDKEIHQELASLKKGGGGGTHVVKAGDTLWDIAAKTLGDGNRWKEIARASKLGKGFDPKKLQIGTKLTIPGKSTAPDQKTRNRQAALMQELRKRKRMSGRINKIRARNANLRGRIAETKREASLSADQEALVELAGRIDVDAYQRTSKSGKVVNVRRHFRSPAKMSLDAIKQELSEIKSGASTDLSPIQSRNRESSLRRELTKRGDVQKPFSDKMTNFRERGLATSPLMSKAPKHKGRASSVAEHLTDRELTAGVGFEEAREAARARPKGGKHKAPSKDEKRVFTQMRGGDPDKDKGPVGKAVGKAKDVAGQGKAPHWVEAVKNLPGLMSKAPNEPKYVDKPRKQKPSKHLGNTPEGQRKSREIAARREAEMEEDAKAGRVRPLMEVLTEAKDRAEKERARRDALKNLESLSDKELKQQERDLEVAIRHSTGKEKAESEMQLDAVLKVAKARGVKIRPLFPGTRREALEDLGSKDPFAAESEEVLDWLASHLGQKGTGTAKGTIDDPINVHGNILLAAKLLAEGKHIRLNHVDEVGTLIDKLAEVADDMIAKGGKAPDFDLCKVSVPKTNLFCAQSKGIPRTEMPQLAGYVVPGFPGDDETKYPHPEGHPEWGPDLTKAFENELRERGVKIVDKEVPAAHLKATQNFLKGLKVQGIARAMREGNLNEPHLGVKQGVPEQRIMVTRDGYIVDGHHRWAAKVALDARNGELGKVTQPVMEVDMEIGELLAASKAYAIKMGIFPAGADNPKDSLDAARIALKNGYITQEQYDRAVKLSKMREGKGKGNA